MRRCWFLAFLLSANTALAVEFRTGGIVDVELPFSHGTRSWVHEGLGKLYYDESDDRRPHLAFAGIDLDTEFTTQHALRGTLVYNDGPRGGVQMSELFYQYRPVSMSERRYQLKLGIFIPSFSMENVGAAWSSAYSPTTSVLGSWVQEEIRATGVQFSTTWLGRFRGSPADITVTVSAFYDNDPAGAMLSWRGWAGHQRIPGWGTALPAPPLPFILKGFQAQKFEPFEELDHRPGGYVQVDYRRDHWALLGAFWHNGAETKLLIDKQYTWRTRFGDLGYRWWNEDGWEVLVQWMYGDTKMESTFRANVVVNDFDAWYYLVSKSWNRHRAMLRVEHFVVEDLDTFPNDDNEERGNALTALYAYRWRDNWEVSAQALRIVSMRGARAYLGLARTQTESQLLFGIRFLW